MKRIIVIGNAPIKQNIREKVETADKVVRFNLPHHDIELVGSRTDSLFTVNSGNRITKFINRGIYESDFFRQARQVVLPWSPLVIRELHPEHKRNNWLKLRKYDNTSFAFKNFMAQGKQVTVLSESVGRQCYKVLGMEQMQHDDQIPSTGFVAIKYLTSIFPDAKLEVCGFTWKGWKGHAWEREKMWIKSQPNVEILVTGS